MPKYLQGATQLMVIPQYFLPYVKVDKSAHKWAENSLPVFNTPGPQKYFNCGFVLKIK